MKNHLSLGSTFHQLNIMIDRQSEDVLQQKYRIGYSQFKILTALLWRENVRQREIADFLGQTEASVSRQIGILIEQGLVSSRRDVQNKRQYITSLTGRGAQMARQAVASLEAHHAPMFRQLTVDKQAAFKDILDTLYTYISAKEGR